MKNGIKNTKKQESCIVLMARDIETELSSASNTKACSNELRLLRWAIFAMFVFQQVLTTYILVLYNFLSVILSNILMVKEILLSKVCYEGSGSYSKHYPESQEIPLII